MTHSSSGTGETHFHKWSKEKFLKIENEKKKIRNWFEITRQYDMKQWIFSVELVRDGRIFLLYMTPHSPYSIVIFGEDHERN